MSGIFLLGTGGTIACDPAKRPLSPVRTAKELLTFLPDAGAVTALDLPEQIDSTEMTLRLWTLLGKAAAEILPQADALIITHGTDTMAYTAALFSYWFSGTGKPLIFTGSQYPMGMEGGDGPENLSLALSAARKATPGVWIAFGGQLIPGARATKTDTQGLAAFEAPNGPGAVPEKPLKSSGPSPLAERVLLLRLAPGVLPELVPDTLDGLVLEVYGAGGLPEIWARAVERWSFPTAVVSQCSRGGLSLSRYAVGTAAQSAGVLDGGDMTAEAAYTKLLWLLGQNLAGAALRNAFETNLCGERK